MSAHNTRDLSGLKFGKLTAIRQVGHRKFPAGGSHAVWEVVCECGTVKNVIGATMLSGHTKSCGCSRRERPPNLRHGHAGKGRTATYKLWASLKLRRCGVDPRWSDYANFLADMGEQPKGLELDRIDNSKGYGPGNCRWVSRLENMANRQVTIMVELDGKQVPLSWLGRQYGLKYHTIRLRYMKGKRGKDLVAPSQQAGGGLLVLKD